MIYYEQHNNKTNDFVEFANNFVSLFIIFFLFRKTQSKNKSFLIKYH